MCYCHFSGFALEDMMPSKVITENERKSMVASYLSGATMKEAAAPFGYSWGACRFALKQAGVQPRSRSEAHRRYDVDESFFDVIDTEEKAYWLGFFLADGTLVTSRDGKPKGCKLVLSSKDAGHLEKWRASSGSDHPIRLRTVLVDGKKYEAAEVIVLSCRMATKLMQHGVVPNKSLIAEPCDVGSLQRHYWRGVFDGDGYIGKTGGSWVLNLTGTEAVVDAFRLFLLENGVRVRAKISPRRNANVWSFRICGTELPKHAGEVLWSGASVYLDRKYKKYTRMSEAVVQRKDRSDLTKEKLLHLYKRAGSWDGVASFLGTSRGRLFHIRRRVGL